MRSYKSKEEWLQEKAEFETFYNYIKSTDPDNYEDWFDDDILDLYVRGKRNPYFSAQRVRPGYEKVSMVRVPTRCPKCRKAWAIECHVGNKFEPHYLDPEVYNNIPLVEGDCHKCKEEK